MYWQLLFPEAFLLKEEHLAQTVTAPTYEVSCLKGSVARQPAEAKQRKASVKSLCLPRLMEPPCTALPFITKRKFHRQTNRRMVLVQVTAACVLNDVQQADVFGIAL